MGHGGARRDVRGPPVKVSRPSGSRRERRTNAEVLEYERVEIRGLLDRLRGAAGAMSRLGVDADEDRVAARLGRLKGRRILE